MDAKRIIELVKSVVPDAEVIPDGEGCNFNITVISNDFINMRAITRHQKVLSTFSELLRTGDLHAVNLKTYSLDEWEENQKQQQPVNIQPL